MSNSQSLLSNWEKLRPNDNPNDRNNCFIATVAALYGCESINEFIKVVFDKNANFSDFVKITLDAHNCYDTDSIRGAYLDELKQFYKDLGLNYIKEFTSMQEMVDFVKDGEKKRFAMAFCWEDAELSVKSGQTVSTAKGHVVALRINKSNGRNSFRIHDFQLVGDHPSRSRTIINKLPDNSKPPYYLFEYPYI